jgi:hypothetical protein
MTEYTPNLERGQPVADVRHCGKCVDLVGTDKEESVDLEPLHMADCLEGFFFREVDLKIGAFELWDHRKQDMSSQDYELGVHQTIFLSE